MCGLIGWLGKNKEATDARARDYVIDQFEDQQGRGTKGFGVVRIDNKGIIQILRSTEPVKMMFDLYGSEVRHILFHHRLPTSSANTLDQTHPLEVMHDELDLRWFIMHNGGVSNDDTLKTKHEKLGYVYLTEYREKYTNYTATKFNDSEALAIELARFFEKKQDVVEAKGGFAFIAIAATPGLKINKVLIGQNGYGGINLADYGNGFAFASEERAGDAIVKDTVRIFSPRWKGDELEGFDLEKDTILLKYPEVKSVVSPYDYRDHYAGAGFGKHGQTESLLRPKDRTIQPKSRGDKEPKEWKDVTFASYGHIVSFVKRGALGDVFRKNPDHIAVTEFKLAEFERLIIAGKIGEAEDFFNKYVGELYEWFDMSDVLEEALEPMELDVPEKPTTSDILRASQGITGGRMASIASGYLPLFRVCSFCEAVILLAYQLQIELNGNRDKRIGEPKDAEFKEVDELWPGKDDERTTETKKLPPPKGEEIASPAEDMDTEAGGMLSALAERASTLEPEPEDLYREVEDTGETIRSAAELSIMGYLSEVERIAIEEGSPIRIPFQFTKIREVLEKTERRFSTLAHIVKAAKDKAQMEEDQRVRDNGPDYDIPTS